MVARLDCDEIQMADKTKGTLLLSAALEPVADGNG